MLLNKVPLSLYVHLPWCETQCPYCDFSITTDPVNGNDARSAEAIIKDVRQSKDLIADRKFKTIYFGGGTPSLVSPKSIKHILDSIKDKLLKEKASPEVISKNLAELKANKVSLSDNDELVLGADSVIDLEGELISKPKNRDEALGILKKQSKIYQKSLKNHPKIIHKSTEIHQKSTTNLLKSALGP